MLGFSLYLIIGALIAVIAAGGGGYLKGHHDAATSCQSARLETEKAVLAAQVAEKTRQAQAAQKIATDEAARAKTAEAERTELQKRIESYEADVAARLPSDGCFADDVDVRGMRAIGGGKPAGPPEPPRAPVDIRPPGPRP